MTDDRSLERAARSWLEEGPTRAPDRPVEAALAQIQTTRQERDLRIPWRLPTMNPIARIALVAGIAIFAVGGALYLIRPPVGPGSQPTPSPSLPPASIEGTWETTFTRAEMLAAGIADSAEDNSDNYGHFTLSIHAGTVVTEHLAPTTRGSSTATYVVSGNIYTVTTTADEVFSWPFTVTATTLTFGGTGPVTLRVKPWTRIGP